MIFLVGNSLCIIIFKHQKQDLESREHLLEFSWHLLHDFCFNFFSVHAGILFLEIAQQPTHPPLPPPLFSSAQKKEIHPLTRFLRCDGKNGPIKPSGISVMSRAHCLQCSLHIIISKSTENCPICVYFAFFFWATCVQTLLSFQAQ